MSVRRSFIQPPRKFFGKRINHPPLVLVTSVIAEALECVSTVFQSIQNRFTVGLPELIGHD
ncbi:hypothetical protein [Thiospirillum jenense]|uniref:Uncharacterized protein n=1 Tax=Thiospirillum jenense TaxID=1653858 RepID=A0A839HIK8_9GAMM|nr:hypothetical protein [Thiospirillum jenense]MBB1126529.1 hypothetical protein [Thiospirillum jenense]